MRRAVIASAIIGTAVGVASACTDTLYLSGLRQFDLSFKNARSSKWDSVVVPIIQAGTAKALSMAPVDDTSTVSLPVQFQSNCGADSVGDVTYIRLSNVPYTVRGDDFWKDSSAMVKTSEKVRAYPDGILYNGTSLKSYWEIGRNAIGKLQGDAPVSYHVQLAVFRHMPGGGYSFSSYPAFSRPSRSLAFSALDGLVDGFVPSLDSVGKGYDSVRVSARITEEVFSYSPTSWAIATGVHSRAMRPQGFVGYRTSQGYTFVLPRPVPLSILSPDGRTVRNLPASTSPSWDGRDASGRLVPRGVYMVRGLGLGVLQIAAP